MPAMEEQFEEAIAAKRIPGVVLLASDATGSFTYQRAFGPATPDTPMDLDATFIMASMTKLMTSIAALQCIEQGLIQLTDAVSTVLPELKDVKIITGVDESGVPTYKEAEKAITVRHLLTHTSGLGYENIHPHYQAFRKHQGQTVGDSACPMINEITLPLLFEPGSSWIYGNSTDWLGILVSRLTHQSLQSYFQANLWTPLGIKDFTFHMEQNKEVRDKLVQMSKELGAGDNPKTGLPSRNAEGVEFTDYKVFEDPITDEFGGAGSIGSPVSYRKILVSLLKNDSVLLKPKTVDLMFTPQLNDDEVKGFEAFMFAEVLKDVFTMVPRRENGLNFGLGGMIVMDDVDTGRSKGTMSWSGLPNLSWTLDRQKELAIIYASNVLPFGHYESGKMLRLFEKEMYARYTISKRDVKASI